MKRLRQSIGSILCETFLNFWGLFLGILFMLQFLVWLFIQEWIVLDFTILIMKHSHMGCLFQSFFISRSSCRGESVAKPKLNLHSYSTPTADAAKINFSAKMWKEIISGFTFFNKFFSSSSLLSAVGLKKIKKVIFTPW